MLNNLTNDELLSIAERDSDRPLEMELARRYRVALKNLDNAIDQYHEHMEILDNNMNSIADLCETQAAHEEIRALCVWSDNL